MWPLGSTDVIATKKLVSNSSAAPCSLTLGRISTDFYRITLKLGLFHAQKILKNTKQKPILSGSQLIASKEFQDKLIEYVSCEAGGIEMEGVGVLKDLKSKTKEISKPVAYNWFCSN